MRVRCAKIARITLRNPISLKPNLAAPKKQMYKIRFGDFETEADVAEAFGCTSENLAEITQATNQLEFYEEIRIPKRGRKKTGQFRVVYKPTLQSLRLLQKNIAIQLSTCMEFDNCVQGFTAKRSIVTNARIHLGAKILLHCDLKNFFESIELPAIAAAFRSLGCNVRVATVFAKICSLNGFLPQGSTASPILANMVCINLDADMLVLAASNRATYTRYADDITFSGDTVPAEEAVETIVRKHGFELRDGKCRRQKKGRAQYVTGLTVCDSVSPRVPRRVKRRLRLELHYIHKHGLEDHLLHTGSDEPPHWAESRIDGWIKFIHSVEPSRAQVFAEQWEQRKDNDLAINWAMDDGG